MRRATTLKDVAARRRVGEKYSIEFDKFSGEPEGPNASLWKSYIGMVARSKADLLEKHWADVKDGVKDLIWQDIMVINLYPLLLYIHCP